MRNLNDDLDVEFYGEWYPDLAKLDPEQLHAHWKQFGKAEGRIPNLGCLLQEKGLDLGDLPNRFDWRVYVHLYEDLSKSGIDTRLRASMHFLEYGRGERRIGVFNEEFYTGFYKDLAAFAGDREAAIGHWLAFGRTEGRSPTLRHLAATRGLEPEAVPDELESGELMPPGEDLGARWRLLSRILLQEPPGVIPLWGDSQRDAAFYLSLASCHVRSGHDASAAHIYRGLVSIAPFEAHEGLGTIAERAAWRAGSHQERMNRHVLALAHFREAFRRDDASITAPTHIAKVLGELGCHEESMALSGETLRMHPDSSLVERQVVDSALDAWHAGWADADYLAACGARVALFERASLLARQVSDATRHVSLRGTLKPVRVRINRDRVLIVADCQLPQCVRYRVNQKLEQLGVAGYQAKAVSWMDVDAVFQELSFHDQIIFYRVPAFPEVVRLISMARALGKLTFYEIDDLIFDPIYPPPLETYGGYVGPTEYLNLVKGAALYHAAAEICEFGIASTLPLASRLGKVVSGRRCFLHRNGLDHLSPVAPASNARVPDGRVQIFYGSATKAHNSDFIEEALPGLVRVLDENTEVCFKVVGYLQLPDEVIRRFGNRIEQVQMTEDINDYWDHLRASDINIAVLKADHMSDCKSEIKWLESGVLGIPSVVSPTRNYLDVIRDGVDALVASGPEGWYSALSHLVSDAALRQRIGRAARQRAMDEYRVAAMAVGMTAVLGEAADLHQQHMIESSNPAAQMQ